MSSFDISLMLHSTNQKKQELLELERKLTSSLMTANPVVANRNTAEMAGTRYKERHEEVLQRIDNFLILVDREKTEALQQIGLELRALEQNINELERAYHLAVEQEEEKENQ